MILYVDTSALVKLYVREAGSTTLRAHAGKADVLATSVVAYAETRAAFARLRFSGSSNDARHDQRREQFGRDWDAFLRIEVDAEVLRRAGELAEFYGLRGFDSIHLASALWLAGRVSEQVDFAVFDRRLAAAAAKAGLTVVPKLRARAA